jgi:mono/diheme cytochrome c family protein
MPPYLQPENQGLGSSEHGLVVFRAACAGCHGEQGEGGELGGKINDPSLLSLLSNQVLRRMIITGRADLGMPNFAQPDGRANDFQPLTNKDVDDLVALLAEWRKPAVSTGR